MERVVREDHEAWIDIGCLFPANLEQVLVLVQRVIPVPTANGFVARVVSAVAEDNTKEPVAAVCRAWQQVESLWHL